MSKKSLWMVVWAVAAALIFLTQAPRLYAAGDAYPNKPIKIVVTKAIGGSVDAAIRLVAPLLEKELGATIVVQNMPAGGGRIAAEDVSNTKPDGYTLLEAPLPSAIVGQLMYNSKGDFRKLTPVFNIMQTFQAVTVAYNSDINSFKDLLEKSKTERITMAGSGGMGSNASIMFAMLQKIGVQNLTMVPFPGAAQAAAAVMGGHCLISSQSTAGVEKYVNNKTMKLLAVAGPKRLPNIPDVPTFKELGYNLVVPLTSSLFGPPGLAADKVATLNAAYQRVLKNKQLEINAEKMHVALYPLNAEELGALVKDNFDMIESILPDLKAAAQGKTK